MPEERETHLQHAEYALDLLDCRVQENAYGEVEGIDTLHIGLDALSDSIARLVDLPDTDEAWMLEDVLAYLEAHGRVEFGTIRLASLVREGIKKATYKGLDATSISELNHSLRELHATLSELLSSIREHGDG